jgi:malate dehydrogenase (oxaloacetate-decarboxylating)(NADP+)
MLIAAKTLAATVDVAHLEQGRVYPPLETIYKVSANIAAAVGEDVYNTNLATVHPKPTDMLEFMKSKQFNVAYPIYTCSNTKTHLVIEA